MYKYISFSKLSNSSTWIAFYVIWGNYKLLICPLGSVKRGHGPRTATTAYKPRLITSSWMLLQDEVCSCLGVLLYLLHSTIWVCMCHDMWTDFYIKYWLSVKQLWQQLQATEVFFPFVHLHLCLVWVFRPLPVLSQTMKLDGDLCFQSLGNQRSAWTPSSLMNQRMNELFFFNATFLLWTFV